jgi:hypothetical protein
MVLLNRIVYVCLMGNTYANLPAIKATGAKFDNGAKMWTLRIEGHPLNNVKQRKKLEAMLTELEERGVRLVKYSADGEIQQ